MNLKSIVVGVDGSGNARNALNTAIDLVAEDGVVHVVTAFRPPSPAEVNSMLATLPEEFRETYDPWAGPRGHLTDAEALVRARGKVGQGHFVETHPAAAILDTAEEVGADMIIVGNRGLGRTRRFLLGSVSARVANRAETSFMVVHHDEDDS